MYRRQLLMTLAVRLFNFNSPLLFRAIDMNGVYRESSQSASGLTPRYFTVNMPCSTTKLAGRTARFDLM